MLMDSSEDIGEWSDEMEGIAEALHQNGKEQMALSSVIGIQK